MKIHNYIIAVITITLFGTLFIMFSHVLFENIKKQTIKSTSLNNRSIIHNIEDSLTHYLTHKINILQNALTEHGALDSNDTKAIKDVFNNIYMLDGDFEVVQILYENADFYVSDRYASFVKLQPTQNGESVFAKNWYAKAKSSLAPQIHVCDGHETLCGSTINFSVPVIENGNFLGTLAGVITLENLSTKLSSNNISKNIYTFLLFGDKIIILTTPYSKNIASKENLHAEISQEILDSIKSSMSSQNLFIGNLQIGDYSVGFYVDDSGINGYLNELLQQEVMFILVVIVALVVILLIHIAIHIHFNKSSIKKSQLMNMCFTQSKHGLILLKENYKIVFINDIAKDFLQKLHIDNIASFITDNKEYITHENTSYLITKIPLSEQNHFEGGVVIIEDITEKEELKKIKRKNEYTLIHQAKMIEIGELVGGINHQIRQPINCISVLVGNILHFKHNNMLDDKLLQENLELCQSQIESLSKIIDLYSNYYNNNYDITHFDLYCCIQDAISIIGTAKYSTGMPNNVNDIQLHGKHIMVDSCENAIVQIMLILLSNAIDATQQSDNKNIIITLEEAEEYIIIRVSDYGAGVEDSMKQHIFNEIKTSKQNGVGIGLYFAKRMAHDKLSGDLRLISSANPTTFELTLKNTKQNEGNHDE